mmetsp:Transcript_22915/g.35373  ORF Transcript_22915/g.35373 Transcript_22915/m.35373 type:complete len:788 (-) Transcript_22915:926-3289(-)
MQNSKKKKPNDQVAVGVAVAQETDNDSNSGHTIGSNNQRLLLEALMMSDRGRSRRDRLESWGGMSDLSGVGEHPTIGTGAAALAASALHQTGLFDDVTAAAAAIDMPSTEPNSANVSLHSAIADAHHGPAKVPTKIALTRERKYSVASLSDGSEDGTLPHPHTKTGTEKDQPDIQALVAAAMKSVEGKLGELASGAATEASGASCNASAATGKVSDPEKRSRTWSLGNMSLGFLESGESLPGSISVPSLPSSVSDTAIQAALDAQTALERNHEPIPEETIATRARSHSTISALSTTGLSTALSTSGLSAVLSTKSTKGSSEAKPISVDYDAVAAAVSAAEAATGYLNLAEIASMAPPKVDKASAVPDTKHSVSSDALSSSSPQPMGTPSSNAVPPADLPPIPKSTMSEKDMEAIRARARAAAGYIPPSDVSGSKRSSDSVGSSGSSRAPLKKRRMLPDTVPSSIQGKSAYSTPGAKPPLNPSSKAINTSARFSTPNINFTPPTPASGLSAGSRGQSSQKWDDMFECLVAFIDEQKKKEKSVTVDKQKWEWDGNVPTTYKTSDGKALGRWINNQRSAKHKGVLKAEREARLIGTGLKWSVLSTNSWTDMMDELRLYVQEKTKDGKPWDGNVPTNYRIKGNGDGEEEDEEKNLGRWINRQRSLYQAGKLKKERQLELEKIGLKWSVLSTTSWVAMYEALCDYVKEKKKSDPGSEWDGNVPANHKTNDNPPKSLGRWVNRQRSAYAKNKLKKEFVDKLNSIGLKWAVHERRTLTGAETQPVASTTNATDQ